jgi:hypothetical protein
MQQATYYIKNLDENKQRLITLVTALLVTFTVLAIFPLNVLVIYLAVRSYANNRLDLYQGIKSEFFDLLASIRKLNTKNSSSNSDSKEVQTKPLESSSESGNNDDVSEENLESSDEDSKKLN